MFSSNIFNYIFIHKKIIIFAHLNEQIMKTTVKIGVIEIKLGSLKSHQNTATELRTSL